MAADMMLEKVSNYKEKEEKDPNSPPQSCIFQFMLGPKRATEIRRFISFHNNNTIFTGIKF